jgi:mono/diheme cytochrome c family protein
MRTAVDSVTAMISRSAIAFLALALGIFVFLPLAAPQSNGNAENGKKVFEKLGCSRCHGSAGEGMGASGKEARPPKIASTHLPLREFVRSVRKPNGQMPPFSARQVSDSELADVYTFLQSAAAEPKLELPANANSDNGQRLYVSIGCYECHGYQGQGSVQTGGSRIGPPQTPYSGFIAYVRQPTGQMPPYTSKAVSDTQLGDIYSFLQSRPKGAPSQSIPLLNQ